MEVKLGIFKPVDGEALANLLRSLVSHHENYLNADEACALMEQSLEERSVNPQVRVDAKVEARAARQRLREQYLERMSRVIGMIGDLLDT